MVSIGSIEITMPGSKHCVDVLAQFQAGFAAIVMRQDHRTSARSRRCGTLARPDAPSKKLVESYTLPLRKLHTGLQQADMPYSCAPTLLLSQTLTGGIIDLAHKHGAFQRGVIA